MRLKDHEAQAIRNAVYRHDADAVIYLFGSRVDDTQRGGDIDLLVISSRLTYEDELGIRQDIEKEIGERKIDIVIASDVQRPFIRIAMSEGVRL